MDNVKGILLILVLILAASTLLLFLQSSAAKAQAQDAQVLGSAAKELLTVQGRRCSADPSEFRKLAECIAPLLQSKDFGEEAFRQPRDGDAGYLVIGNVNRRTYDAALFSFHFNRVLRQRGCDVPGEVGHEVTCRFTFTDQCQKGDILEVFYPIEDEEVRVFLKTC